MTKAVASEGVLRRASPGEADPPVPGTYEDVLQPATAKLSVEQTERARWEELHTVAKTEGISNPWLFLALPICRDTREVFQSITWP